MSGEVCTAILLVVLTLYVVGSAIMDMRKKRR